MKQSFKLEWIASLTLTMTVKGKSSLRSDEAIFSHCVTINDHANQKNPAEAGFLLLNKNLKMLLNEKSLGNICAFAIGLKILLTKISKIRRTHLMKIIFFVSLNLPI